MTIGNDVSASGVVGEGRLSAALATIFRGRICDVVLGDRPAAVVAKDQVIYDLGDDRRSLFFIRSGFVKIGTVTEDGRELIYDVRGAGDIVGELCACGRPRQDRAVALARAEIIEVPFDDVLAVVQGDGKLLRQLLNLFCDSLSEAYEQLHSVAFDDTVHRLVKALVRLGHQLGRPSGDQMEICAYLTQEEIAQMVAVRRERLSTALNFLRSRGLVSYSRRGHILVDLMGLENYTC
jgi:CRP/FNR family transcriptional regulator, cyclic AMP receptor protein